MSVRQSPFVNGEYYHLYNRGNSKNIIFHDDQDYNYFLNLLFLMNSKDRRKTVFTKNYINNDECLVSIGAYCLMPNHFHILIKQQMEKGISIFVQKISTAYVMYYNKKYERTGGLFEGKFKSKYVWEDNYLRHLFSYIHLNPLKLKDENWKSKLKTETRENLSFILKYPYSSCVEYLTDNQKIINKGTFPEYFSTKSDFIKSLINSFSSEY